MRTLHVCTCLALVGFAQAQLINGSFEDGLNGWIPYGPEVNSTSVEDFAAPGSGEHCASISSLYWQWAPQTPNSIFQVLPQLALGSSVEFGGWIKAHANTFNTISCFGLVLANTGGILWSVSTLPIEIPPTSWTYFDTTYEITEDPPTGFSYGLALFGSDIYGTVPHAVYFDGMFVTVDLSTGSPPSAKNDGLHFRPNPATDKLWVDLPETPTAVELYDALGARLPDPAFAHSGRTLEVQCASLDPGIHFLVMRTPNGSKSLRFMKQ